MSHWKVMKTLLLIMTLSFILAACGTSLQKPTGLENEEKQIEAVGGGFQEETAEPSDRETVTENDDDETETVDEPDIQEKTSPTIEEVETPSKEEQSSLGEIVPKEKSPVKKEKSTSDSKEETTTVSPKTPADSNAKPSSEPSEKPVEKPENKEEEQPAAEPSDDKPTKTADTIVYSIVISANEVPLQPTEVEIDEGETVLSALIKITKQHKIQMDYRGGQGATAYIEGIDNVYEFDRGQGSGWMYRVNGIFPDRGAGVVPLQDGDRVEWLYTTNLGVDLKADLKPFRR